MIVIKTENERMQWSELDYDKLSTLSPTDFFVEINSPEDWKQWIDKEREKVGRIEIYVDVWNFESRLAVHIHDSVGHGHTEVVENHPFSKEELDEIVWKQGGSLNTSGWYRIPLDVVKEKMVV